MILKTNEFILIDFDCFELKALNNKTNIIIRINCILSILELFNFFATSS